MSRETVGILLDRWINEPAFRDELRHNPVGTVEKIGLALDEEEWAALKSVDWSLSDEELRVRMSKAM